MVSSVTHSTAKPESAGPNTASANHIPPREPMRAPRRRTLPPRPSARTYTIRMIMGVGLALLAMLALLMLAVKYATHDWDQKNQRAKRVSASATTKKPQTAEQASNAWRYELPRTATVREMKRLTQDPFISNHWLILGRSLTDKTSFQIILSSYWLALAVDGESAAIRNDLGAAYLRQGRIKAAQTQFYFAQKIEPGFVPALFNLALCAIAERNPPKASELLNQYLARRPQDLAALRLQASLLSQSGQTGAALRMLERVLKSESSSHPLFLEAALYAAQLGQQGKAIRYLETSMNGNPIQSVIRVFQSPPFRDIRLSAEGSALSSRLASRARIQYGTPMTMEEIPPLRSAPEAIVR